MGLSFCLLAIFMVMGTSGTGNRTNETDSTHAQWPPYCPASCVCEVRLSSLSQTRRRTVDCGRTLLTVLPHNITSGTESLVLAADRIRVETLGKIIQLANLSELDLTNNHIYSVEDWPVLIPTLQYLVLNQNQIDYLHNRSFTLLPALAHLCVANNKIELMHADAFRGLFHLISLDLHGNRIFAIKKTWWLDLQSLETLNMEDNNIHQLESGAFSGLPSLRVLLLKNNQLKHIHEDAFGRDPLLLELNLAENHLNEVPTMALQKFSNISTLDMSGNHFLRLETGSIQSCNVTVLKLTSLPMLEMVNARAFVKLPLLTRLEMCGNKALQYIDPEAFLSLPKLATIHLHNNNLSTVESGIVATMPQLKSLSLYGNPMFCDCTLGWLVVEGKSNLSLEVPGEVVCAGPPDLQGTRLEGDKDALGSLQGSCQPRLLPLFSREYNTVLGDKIRLDCRAVGIPKPQTNWLLPSHHPGLINDDVRLLKTGSRPEDGHIEVLATGTLYIHYVQGTDHGTYTCLASNPRGRDEKSATVHVKNIRANVIIVSVTSSAVTVTWRSTRYAHDYLILYRQSDGNDTYQHVYIKPYMRTYTASELCSQCAYEFCIAVRHEDHPVRINCTIVTTREENYKGLGVISVRSYIVGGSAAFLIILVSVACVATWLVRRFNKRRRQQEELYSDNLSQLFLASIDSMSDTTPITYENRAAEMFDDDDIEEIRSTASMASTSSMSMSARC